MVTTVWECANIGAVRPTHAEIDLAAIRHNVTAISRVVAPASYCAVVKGVEGCLHGEVID